MKAKKIVSHALIYLFLIIGAVSMILPFAWMISTSLKGTNNVMVYPPEWIPNPAVWSNYPKAIQDFPFFQYLFNNIKICALIVLGTVITSSMAGYAFARMRFPGRNVLFLVILAVIMIPGQITMIPVFLLVKDLGWMDNHVALIIPSIASPFGIFLIRQYMLTLPRDLEDAAYVDGCGVVRIFLKIILPLTKSALAALGVITLMGSWNSFIWPLLLISTKSKQMMTVGLLQFQSAYQTKYNLLMAATVLSILPLFLVYIFCQRYFIEGIAVSGIKG